MSIGSTIKKLRHEQDMTQEQLAALLDLTPAAVSGWECDRNSPDISQIPLLSHIFGVSADVLLGIDLTAQEEKIDRIIVEAEKCSGKEAVDVYRLGLAEFPGSYRLMLKLANTLDYRGDPGTYDSRLKERIALYEKIREGTKDAYLKNFAEGMLCRIYIGQGKRDEALKIAESVPHLMYSHNEFERMLAQGKEKIYNMHYDIQYKFSALCDDIYYLAMQKIDGQPFFTHEQAISILEKIPNMYAVFFENKDYLGEASIVSLAYTRMAEHYAELKDGANALDCLEAAFKNAKMVDAYLEGLDSGAYGMCDASPWDYPLMPKEKQHTSILADPNLDYPTCTLWIAKDEESQVQCWARDISHKRFDFIREEIQRRIVSVS